MKIIHKYTNQLIHETSPYLLQHAHNPVDWYPWGEEALQKARDENKPIFLSIGYSACHWCHVMEYESFENEKIAEVMNEHFINIKVDREERPDLDEIYMNAVQILTGGGGWPLNVFLTPELKPFYGGTYFPPDDMYNRTGFKSVIRAIAKAWEDNRNDIIDNSDRLLVMIRQNEDRKNKTTAKLSDDIFEIATSSLLSAFDPEEGGFGSAPKFPSSMAIEFLMSQYTRTHDNATLNTITKTLDNMANGGIYDHIGGGFHRYSTDRKWLVPHFEKMLYDNALLSDLYLKGYQLTGKPLYKKVAVEVLDYILREMTDDTGGFHSTLDADSEGKEGVFYLWTYQEIIDAFGIEDGRVFNDYYSVEKNGNFSSPEEYHTGRNILHRKAAPSPIGYKPASFSSGLQNKIDSLRSALYEIRKQRVSPKKDDKIITAWNGLMISSLVHGYQVLGNERYLDAAEKAARFILTEMNTNGNMLRIYRHGTAKQDAYLDDYAFFINALIDLYEGTFDIEWLIEAEKLTGIMIQNFWDSRENGFFFTSAVHKNLITRTKPVYDGSIPSGNSGAAYVLLRLAKLLNRREFIKKADEIFTLFSDEMRQAPRGYMALLKAADFHLHQPKEIALAGKADSEGINEFLTVLHHEFVPNKIIAFIDNTDENRSVIEEKIPLLKNKGASSGVATAYICRNFTCQLPVTDPKQFKEMIMDN